MSSLFDPSDDLAAVSDGLETVTLLRRGSTPGSPGTVITHALRRAIVVSEATVVTVSDVHKQVASGGRNKAADVAWHLPVAELPESPQMGDWIVDGDRGRWTITEVRRTTLGTRWRCTARNVAIAFGLDDTISVLKATYAKGPGGAAEPTWRVWKTGVRAAIQPQQIKVVADADTHATTSQYRIFVEEELELDHTCRIRDADGTLYAILRATGADRIGELQVIDAEVTQ
jgi:hypothetical protein